MPGGKPAGVRCTQLDTANRCLIFRQPERPAVCGQLQPEPAMCGPADDQGRYALAYLAQLEALTAPK